MIPRIIHQIWIGDQEARPTRWMRTFENLSQFGWQYKLWTEAEIDNFGPFNRDQYDWLYDREIWFGCSDVVRYEILEQFGGWYFDADSELLGPWTFATAEFHQTSHFVVARPVKELPSRPGRLPSTTIGAAAEHPILTEAVELVSRLQGQQLLPPWDAIGGTLMTKAIDNLKMRDSITILDARAFYPFNIDGTIAPETAQPVYSVHRWGSTYGRYGEGHD